MAKQIKDSLKRAVAQLPHPDEKALWEQPVIPMKEHDYITRQDQAGSRRRYSAKRMKFAAGFACLFLLASGGYGWYGQNLAVYSIIGMDVNPSVEITTNRKHKVLEVDALNEEAEQLLDGRNYQGWDVADTVETLAVSMEQKGYFKEKRNAVLLTVNGKKESDAKTLAGELSGKILLAVDKESAHTTVITQTLLSNDEFKEVARQNQVSFGKVRLAAELSALLPQFTREQLVTLPLETLLEAMELLEEDLPADIVVQPSRYETVPTVAEPTVEATVEPVSESVAETTKAPENQVQTAPPAPSEPPISAPSAPVPPAPAPPPTVAPEPPTSPPPVQEMPTSPPAFSQENDDSDDDDDQNDDDQNHDDQNDDDQNDHDQNDGDDDGGDDDSDDGDS